MTAASFAWIGASAVAPGPAAALRRAATSEYRRLEAALPGVRVRWSGSVSWSRAPWPSEAESAQLDRDQSLLTPAQVAAMEPNLREPPARALQTLGDGAVDPVAVTDALVRAAKDHGAQVLVGTAVISLRVRSGRVVGVETSAEFVRASTVVLAAGIDVPVLCAPLGIEVPVAPSPSLLVRCTGASGVVKTVVASPEVEVRESADGALLAAVDYRGESTHSELARAGRRTLDHITSMFHGADAARVAGAYVGWRPMPVDEEPITGPVVGGLYLVVMHSGVTLAPVAGRLAAEEIVHTTDSRDLHGCRLTRFARPRAQRS